MGPALCSNTGISEYTSRNTTDGFNGFCLFQRNNIRMLITLVFDSRGVKTFGGVSPLEGAVETGFRGLRVQPASALAKSRTYLVC